MATWNEKTIARLKALWANDKLTASEIGIKMGGISKNAVIGKARRLRLPKRPSPVICTKPRIPKPKLPKVQLKVQQAPKPPAPVIRPAPTCCWPLGDPRDKQQFSYCGKPSLIGKSYCKEHYQIAYTKTLSLWRDVA